MNDVTLTGRITKDLELRKTTNNKSVCQFRLAVRRDKENTDFIPITAYGIPAENLCQYQGKGSLIAVRGSIRINADNKNGEYKEYWSVIANEIEYLESKKSDTEKKYNEFVNDNFQTPLSNDLASPDDYHRNNPKLDISSDDLPFY